MLSKNAAIQTVDTALLSAMSAGREPNSGGAALLQVAGQPLLLHQIQRLVAAEIRKFLVEVDVVSGAVIAVADRMKLSGISVEFIRSPADLQGRLGDGELLLVMSDGVVASDDLIAEMVSRPSASIVTLDGRKENDIFERIDLNSFWSGMALLDRRTVGAIASFPEGWSIGSSLLRQALQDAVVHRPLAQELVTSKLFRRVLTQDEAEGLTKELLIRRAHHADGFIEAHLFGPVAARFAPLVWKSPLVRRMVEGGLSLAAAAAAGLAAAGFAVPAMAALLISLFLAQLQYLAGDGQRRGKIASLVSGAVWAAASGAIFLIGWDLGSSDPAALFTPLVMLALLLYAAKAPLSMAQKALIASPALAALLLLLAAAFGAWPAGLCFIIVAQLAILLWPHYYPRFDNS